jgi:hypothetical protein
VSRLLRSAVAAFSALALLAAPAFCTVPVTSLIDTPTAEVVDHYGYNLSFRTYTGGGLLTKAGFGVFPRLNIGFGLDTEKFVGPDPVDLNAPTLNVKLRFFDGKRNLPALALGYDGQGYFFDKTTDHYLQREKGLYLVGTGEAFVPDLTVNAGLNIYDFKQDKVYSFAGLSYLYEDLLGLTFEADNLHGPARANRMNAGVRYFVTPALSVDVDARDLWAASRKTERIILINYYGSF